MNWKSVWTLNYFVLFLKQYNKIKLCFLTLSTEQAWNHCQPSGNE